MSIDRSRGGEGAGDAVSAITGSTAALHVRLLTVSGRAEARTESIGKTAAQASVKVARDSVSVTVTECGPSLLSVDDVDSRVWLCLSVVLVHCGGWTRHHRRHRRREWGSERKRALNSAMWRRVPSHSDLRALHSVVT
jgi:hypothetical protein